MQYLMVFITTPNRIEAKKISNLLLEKRIIACSNIIKEIDSHFWWQGKKERAKECLLIAKTRKTSLKKLIKLVRSIHPYEVPEVIAIPIMGGYKAYLDWIKEATT